MQEEYGNAKLNPDKPIEISSEDDKLSFNRIVEAIISLLQLPDRPFTFGLFGKWGTGKSTILGEIEKRLDKNDYYVVTFDAWKYEGDALRRSFLTSIATQLNEKIIPGFLGNDKKVLSDKFLKNLKEDTYQVKSETKDKPKIKIKNIVIVLIIFLVLFVSQVILALVDTDKASLLPKVSPLILAFLMGGSAIVISAFSPSSIGKLFVKQVNIGTDKLSSPEEFYDKFLEILKEIEDKTLLVIIDNLDRTQKDATVELLGTIKTFLNADRGSENVVFLVASDHKAIKRHIKEVYSKNDDDAYEAEEFIKKFFNAIIEVPPFISSEYTNYLIDLIDKSGVATLKSHQGDIISIILAGYPDNPRGAKHFINSLVVYLIMLSSIGHAAGVEQEFIEKNLNFIATMLVIRDRFDDVYDRIQNEVLTHEQSWDEIEKTIAPSYRPDRSPTSKEKDFNLFFEAFSSWVSPESGSLRWFFNMRRSDEEQKLPSWDAFVSSVNKNDQERAVKYLVEFSEEPVILNTLLQQHIRNIKSNTPRWTAFTSVYVGFLVNASNEDLVKLSSSMKDTLRAFPGASEFAKFANQVNTGKLIKLLSNDLLNEAERRRVRTAINGHLRTGRASVETLLEIVQAENSTNTPNRSTVQAIAAHIGSNRDYAESSILLDALTALDHKQELITNEANNITLAALTQSDLENETLFNSKLSFIRASRYVNRSVLDKISEIMTWLQSTSNATARSIVSRHFHSILKITKDIPSVMDPSGPQYITQYLISWYQQLPNDYRLNREYITLLSVLAEQENNPYAQSARDIIKQFLDTTDADNLLYVLKKFRTNEALKQITIQSLNERLLSDTSLMQRLEVEAREWLPDNLLDIAYYLVDNSERLSDEQLFSNAIKLSREIANKASDDVEYEERLYAKLQSLASRFTSSISSFVYKRNNNILKSHPDWLLELKRILREE